jgi:hypothetical protein
MARNHAGVEVKGTARRITDDKADGLILVKVLRLRRLRIDNRYKHQNHD